LKGNHALYPRSARSVRRAVESSPQTSPSGNERAPKSAPNTLENDSYDVITDKMVSVGPGWLKTQQNGLFEIGEVNGLGMVERIRNRTARVKKPNGRTLYVVAGDWTPPPPVKATKEERPDGKIVVAPAPSPYLVPGK